MRSRTARRPRWRSPTTNPPAFCSTRWKKATGKGIYGAVFLLYDSNHNPIGEYADQNGYIYADEGLEDGRYYLREIKAAPGYVLDPELKTIYVRYGSTTEIEWSNTAECGGEIQIIKKSADDNATNGLPAGTLLEGAVFEIYDKAGNVVDTIKSDRNGRAVSKTLPLSRYTVREIKAPANYSINPTVMTAYLEFNGQIVTFEVQNTQTFPRACPSRKPVLCRLSPVSPSAMCSPILRTPLPSLWIPSIGAISFPRR